MSENNNLETKDTADLEAQETVVLESDETVEQEVLETKKERKKRKSILPKIILFLILVLFALLGLIVKYFFDSQKPIQENSEKVLFTVPEDATVQSLTDKLFAEGIIRDGKMSYYYVRYKKYSEFYAGEYEIDKSWNIDQIFEAFSEPRNAIENSITVTIPEGYWARDAAQVLSEKLNIPYDDIIALWNNKEWIESKMKDYPFLTEDIFKNKESRVYLEGYIHPNTYEFKEDSTAEDVTIKLLDQMLMVYQPYAEEIENSLLTTHQIFTLASIVQFEAGGSVPDQKEIAGVLYNRMANDMNLEVSASVCYAIDFNPETHDWTECETNSEYDSEYNTYMYEGLTPGPICNFAESCLDAAVRPNITSNYYFMADVYGDGTIYYAETYEEHLENVEKYLDGKY